MKELFVRKLNKQERDFVYSLIDDKMYGYRGLIIALSYDGYPVGMIARKLNIHPVNVRKWIRRFNKLGVEGIAPKKLGKKRKLDKKVEDDILKIALTKPEEFGLYFSTWSLRKLETYLKQKKIANLSHTQLRKILKSKGLSFKKSTLKLISQDPQYMAKKHRIQRLWKKPNCLVLFEDEKHIVAKEYPGYEWCFRAKTVRLNQRIKGKEMLFLAYNPHAHKILRMYLPDMGKENFCKFLRFLSKRAKEDIYLILDNHPSHLSKDAEQIFKQGKIKPVWLPKNAPELNDADKIIFSLIQREVLQNRTFGSLEDLELAIDKWIRKFNSNEIAISLQN